MRNFLVALNFISGLGALCGVVYSLYIGNIGNGFICTVFLLGNVLFLLGSFVYGFDS